jgi:uncharacterized damage-inducible protein DinB
MLQDFIDEYRRYRLIGERALAQIPDEALNHVPAAEANSAAMIVFHVSGNLKSRFTDFLTTDGEKPWRARDVEFVDRTCSRAEVDALWSAGWGVLESTLATLSTADLERTVTIRKQELSVHAALCRSLAHMSYHVGQIVLLARMTADQPWRYISIPKGGSDAYNATPTGEKAPQ